MLLLTPQLDLGQGAPGESLTGHVRLKNDGGQPLHIEGVEAGCACSALRLARKTFAPGEETDLEVTARLRPGERQLSFPVRISSNDPETPVATLLVVARAGPPLLHTEPARVAFGEVAIGTAASRELRLFTPEGRPWPANEPVTVESASGTIQAQTKRLEENGAAATLVVAVQPRPKLPLGCFNDTLTLRPAGTSRSVEIAVHGNIVPPVLVSPTALYFGDVTPSSNPLQRFVMLRRTDGKPLAKVVKSTAPLPLNIAEADAPESNSKVMRLRVTLAPDVLRQDIRNGELRIWLEGEPEPLVVRLMIFRVGTTKPGEG